MTEASFLIEEAKRRGLPIPPELEYFIMREEARRRGIFPWPTYRAFVEDINPTVLLMEHVPTMVDAAQQVLDGVIRHLLVMLPRRYLKTEIFGRLLCAYYMLKWQDRLVGLASYNSAKAWEVSDAARQYYTRARGKLDPARSAKRFWGPPGGGEVWAVGVEEGGIGRGFHLGIVDDPIDPKKALRSTIMQESFELWWSDKWLGSREPGASIIFDMQRLGMNDPIDYLFRREVGEGVEQSPMHWHVLVLDEIKSTDPLGRWDGPQGLPATCTLINDDRTPGQYLAPSRFSVAEVKVMRSGQTSSTVAAQRQQRPFDPKGDFWQAEWFRTYEQLPSVAYDGGKDWDTAYGEDHRNSASAWVESYRGPPSPDGSFDIFVENVGWDWLEFPKLVALIAAVTGPHYVEQKASGKSAAQTLRANGILAHEVAVHGGKLERASAAQPTASTGRVYVRRQVRDLLLNGDRQGLLKVTAEMLRAGAPGLDLNDAFVQAVHRHLKLGVSGKRARAGIWVR